MVGEISYHLIIHDGAMMNENTTLPKMKCPCGRPIATEKEHVAAHAAGKCSFCFDFNNYVHTVVLKKAQS